VLLQHVYQANAKIVQGDREAPSPKDAEEEEK
jgi:hypothetical protein